MTIKYWIPQPRTVSAAEIRCLQNLFGIRTLKFNRRVKVWKFDSSHTHTIRLVPPGVKKGHREVLEGEMRGMNGEPLSVAIYIDKFGQVVEFEFTRLDGKRLREVSRWLSATVAAAQYPASF